MPLLELNLAKSKTNLK